MLRIYLRRSFQIHTETYRRQDRISKRVFSFCPGIKPFHATVRVMNQRGLVQVSPSICERLGLVPGQGRCPPALANGVAQIVWVSLRATGNGARSCLSAWERSRQFFPSLPPSIEFYIGGDPAKILRFAPPITSPTTYRQQRALPPPNPDPIPSIALTKLHCTRAPEHARIEAHCLN